MKKKIFMVMVLCLLLVNANYVLAETLEVVKTDQSLSLDGQKAEANAYKIKDNNYFKLRDIAALLVETQAKFNVGFDQASQTVVIELGKDYTIGEDDLKPIELLKTEGSLSPQKILVDGKEVSPTVYLINGNNYFKLRDLGKAIGFNVDYDASKKEMMIDSKSKYVEPKSQAEKPVDTITNPSEVLPKNGKISSENVKAAGLSLKVVTVPNTSNFKFSVVKGNDALTSSEAFSSIISRYKPTAAVNGNFFDAYKTLVPYGNIFSNGEALKIIGNDPGFYVTNSGKRGVVKSDVVISVKTSEGKTFNVWYKNTPTNDTSGIYMFTPYYGQHINVKAGTVVLVKDSTIQSIEKVAGQVNIPADGYIIYLGPDAVDQAYIDNMFKIGNSITMEYVFEAPELQGERVKEMVCAGPLLVKDGVDVSGENKGGYEGKIRNQSAQRSAIGVTKDGTVKIVTTKATASQLAKAMLELGCVAATNLDGGASSALYANGKILTSPGRKLSTVLLIFQ